MEAFVCVYCGHHTNNVIWQAKTVQRGEQRIRIDGNECSLPVQSEDEALSELQRPSMFNFEPNDKNCVRGAVRASEAELRTRKSLFCTCRNQSRSHQCREKFVTNAKEAYWPIVFTLVDSAFLVQRRYQRFVPSCRDVFTMPAVVHELCEFLKNLYILNNDSSILCWDGVSPRGLVALEFPRSNFDFVRREIFKSYW
jgi:hypothetical protein